MSKPQASVFEADHGLFLPARVLFAPQLEMQGWHCRQHGFDSMYVGQTGWGERIIRCPFELESI